MVDKVLTFDVCRVRFTVLPLTLSEIAERMKGALDEILVMREVVEKAK